MDKSAPQSIKNNILASLVPFLNEDGGSFVARLEPVELRHGSVLYETGEQDRHVYFSNNSLICRFELIEKQLNQIFEHPLQPDL